MNCMTCTDIGAIDCHKKWGADMTKPSLRQIASELEISPAYLSYMVNGKRPWRKDLYQRYMGVVNTFVNSIQRGNNEVSLNSDMINERVPVAQGIERLPSKQRVVGSNPTWGTIPSFRG